MRRSSEPDRRPPAPSPASPITDNPAASLDPLLTQIVGVIVHGFDPARIVLFGERLRIDRRRDTEYKFVVVLDQPERRWEKATEIRMAFGELPVLAEVVVAPAAEVDGSRRPAGDRPSRLGSSRRPDVVRAPPDASRRRRRPLNRDG